MRPAALSRCVRALALMLVCGAAMGTSCLNPCEQLAEKICGCEATELERQACKRQAKIQQDQRQLGNEDRLLCQQLLASCECRALKEGKLEVCGLSRE